MKFTKTMLLSIVVSIGLMGCSLVEEGKNSIDYAQKATDYVNEISAFANEAPALVKRLLRMGKPGKN